MNMSILIRGMRLMTFVFFTNELDLNNLFNYLWNQKSNQIGQNLVTFVKMTNGF
jgi:hypothetical protein